VQRLFLAATLVLAVAGCSNEPKTVSVDPYANQIIPLDLSPEKASAARAPKQVIPRNLAPSIRAEAPAHESKETKLMECMSEGCRVMCSPTMQSKPRWCSYFKEPADPTQKNAATKL
jgi:Prokaryotic membrane lipoprotein lipid attachment site